MPHCSRRFIPRRERVARVGFPSFLLSHRQDHLADIGHPPVCLGTMRQASPWSRQRQRVKDVRRDAANGRAHGIRIFFVPQSRHGKGTFAPDGLL